MWLFGYGSLMWRPGFDHAGKHRATLRGRQRALCVRTVHHRGAPGQPGLVMGLKPGGSCIGMAYRVAAEDAETVAAYLRERELDHYPVYRESSRRRSPCRTAGRCQRRPICRAPDHPDFLPDLSSRRAACHYPAGQRRQRQQHADYVRHAAQALRDLGIDEPAIIALESALG